MVDNQSQIKVVYYSMALLVPPKSILTTRHYDSISASNGKASRLAAHGRKSDIHQLLLLNRERCRPYPSFFDRKIFWKPAKVKGCPLFSDWDDANVKESVKINTKWCSLCMCTRVYWLSNFYLSTSLICNKPRCPIPETLGLDDSTINCQFLWVITIMIIPFDLQPRHSAMNEKKSLCVTQN